MGKNKNSKLPSSKKYKLYESSVQCVESDVNFINQQYYSFYGVYPTTLREDFGGTAKLCCKWVKQSDNHKSWSIDLDDEPVSYGKKNHYSKLNSNQQDRMKYIMGNVLDTHDFKTDIVAAFNFSYYTFKTRQKLLTYFKKVKEHLNLKGMFCIDLFGGTDCYSPIEDSTKFDKFTYYWDCKDYNPITSECKYSIHFKLKKNGVKYEDVFTYDWRMWSFIELTELLQEAGFKTILKFWEDDDEEGKFYVSEKEQNQEAWVCYICAFN